MIYFLYLEVITEQLKFFAMDKKLLLTLLILLTITLGSYAQRGSDWRSSSLNNNANYYDVVSKKRTTLKNQLNPNSLQSKKAVKQFERWAAFWKDRVLPNGSFVSAKHTYNEWKKYKETNSNGLNSKSATTSWSLVGPNTIPIATVDFYAGMGRINAVAFNGSDTNTLFVGTPAGGVWKSSDGGTTWIPKGDNFPNLGVSDIVIDPTNTNVLYLATGDFDAIHTRSVGVLKSTDAGNTWNTTGLTFALTDNNIIGKLLIDSNNTNTVFAGTKNSIKRTTDGGTNWTDVYTFNDSSFHDLMYKSGSATTIYAASKWGEFLLSKDNGATWTSPAHPATTRIDLAITPNDPNLILSIDEGGVVRKSTDDGANWTTVSTIANYSSQNGYNMTLAISPLDKNLVIAGGVHGWRSKDGGVTWEKYLDGYWTTGSPYFYVHSDHHDMKFVPGTNTIFSVNDGGIHKGDASIDTKWTDLSSGLAITQYYNVAGTPQNADLLIMGAQDNDVVYYNGQKWAGKNPGSDGVEALWDYSDSNIAWTCSQQGSMERTIDGFATSQQITTPAGAPFVWELEIHPTVPTTIYGGFGDIYKSTDRGDNWTNLSSGAGAIEYISIAPSNADVIFVSGENGTVKKTSNGGTLWSDVTLPQAGKVKSIEIHPTNPAEIYIAYSGYLAGKVYKSVDSGANWTNITGTLPNVPTHKILYKTGSVDGELFLATDLGVYYRTNSKGDWSLLSGGLPNVIVHDLEIHYGTEKLRAATYGRGLWEVSITNASLGIEDKLLPNKAVSLFPNPAVNKNFYVRLNGLSGESTITVYNIIGGVVKNFKTNSGQEKIDLTNFSKGLYLVKVLNNEKSIVKKILVK